MASVHATCVHTTKNSKHAFVHGLSCTTVSLTQRDSLMRRAAAELVDRAVGIALNAISPTTLCIPPCPTGADASRCLLDQRICPSDPAERLLTTEMLNDDTLAWPIEQVVTELSQAAQVRLPDLEWQQLTGEKSFPPGQGWRSHGQLNWGGSIDRGCLSIRPRDGELCMYANWHDR